MFDQATVYKVNGKSYRQEHGNAFDRGSADSWYSRARNPHKGGSGGKYGFKPVTNLTPAEVEAYHAGYDYNEQHGGKKSYD